MAEKQTTVISLYGGPGSGKSTTAAALFSELKLRGKSAELVTEYVKSWAWRGIKVGEWDQLYIFGKQSFYEAQLYGKVDYIVTDSPILLAAFYEEEYSVYAGWKIVSRAAFEFVRLTGLREVKRQNYWLHRTKKYDPSGRYQTEDQAKQIDINMKNWLNLHQVEFEEVTLSDRDRMKYLADKIAPV